MIRLSGVLKRPDTPPWVPHDEEASETEAVAAIIKHMERDALRLDLLDDKHGPICFATGTPRAWGNFTVASGGFEIDPLSPESRDLLTAAFKKHRRSQHFRAASEIAKLESLRDSELMQMRDRTNRHSSSFRNAENAIRTRWNLRIMPLNALLESIYKRTT